MRNFTIIQRVILAALVIFSVICILFVAFEAGRIVGIIEAITETLIEHETRIDALEIR